MVILGTTYCSELSTMVSQVLDQGSAIFNLIESLIHILSFSCPLWPHLRLCSVLSVDLIYVSIGKVAEISP